MRQRLLKTVCAALTIAFAASTAPVAPAYAQEKPADFPQRPINLVVVYPAGGGMDVTARTFADVAEKVLGHDFRVENRVGGAGMVGHTYLAKQAASDGYTVGVVANPFLFNDILLRGGNFSKDDFEPLAFINFSPAIWTVNAESELGDKSLDEIVAAAKEKSLRVGVMPNNVFEFVTEFIEREKDVGFNHVPFQGGKPGVVALLSGDVHATTAFYVEIEQYLKSDKLRAVAVADDERFPPLPDTPTFPELGVSMAGDTWGAARFMVLPKGVPEERKRYLEQAFLKVLNSEQAEKAFDKIGIILSPAGMKETKESYGKSYEALETFLNETGRLGG